MTTPHDTHDVRRPAWAPARLLAVVLALFAGLAVAAPASASPAQRCAAQSISEHAANAELVLLGTAGSRLGRQPSATPGQKTPAPTRPEVWTVTVERVFAGTPDASALEVTVPPLLDVVALREGGSYVLFLARGDNGWVVRPCSGSQEATGALVERVGRALSGGSVIEKEPVTAQRTVVEEDEPTTLVRLAAPGGALALVGLLGLILVGRMGERSER